MGAAELEDVEGTGLVAGILLAIVGGVLVFRGGSSRAAPAPRGRAPVPPVQPRALQPVAPAMPWIDAATALWREIGGRVIDPNTPAVQSWRGLFEKYGAALGHPGDRPVERLLTWTAIESGGNPCSLDATRKAQLATGHVPDVGPMQLYFETPSSTIHGVTSAQLRAGCIGTTQEGTCSPAVRDLQAKISCLWLADQIAIQDQRLANFHVAWSPRDRWRWYKFATHGLPAVALCMLPLVEAEFGGRAPVDWAEFRHVCETIDLAKVQAAAALPNGGYGCTAALAYHGLWEQAFRNAEEMDLPDEKAAT